jgi:sarcosine oxidase, subunit delta
MRIVCPHCGTRDQIEFTWGGDADIVRPDDPGTTSEAAWSAYLYLRANARGRAHERWCHTYGCGQWFTLRRDTFTHEVETS